MRYNINTTSMVYHSVIDFYTGKHDSESYVSRQLYFETPWNIDKKYPLENGKFKIKFDKSYINYRVNESIEVQIMHPDLPKHKKFTTLITLKSIIEEINNGVEVIDGILNNTYTLLMKKNICGYASVCIPNDSPDVKEYIRLDLNKKKRGTSNLIPGHLYLDKRSLNEYIFLGKVDCYCQYYNYYDSNNMYGGILNTPERGLNLFIKNKGTYLKTLLDSKLTINELIFKYLIYFIVNKDDYFIQYNYRYENPYSLTVRPNNRTFIDEGKFIDGDFDLNIVKKQLENYVTKEEVLEQIKENPNNYYLRGSFSNFLMITKPNEKPEFTKNILNNYIYPLIKNNGFGQFYGDANDQNTQLGKFIKYIKDNVI